MSSNVLEAGTLRDRVQTLATGAGIRRWDLGAACSDDCSVQVDRGEAKQMKAAQRSSITVRVWNADGLVGITSTTDLTDAGLSRALDGAHQASAFGNPDDVPQFSPLAMDPLPPLDRPLKPRQGILTLLDAHVMLKRSCWGSIPPSRPSPTTDWRNPSPPTCT